MTLKIGDHVSHRTLGYLGTVTVIADGGIMAMTSSGQQAKTQDLLLLNMDTQKWDFGRSLLNAELYNGRNK